MKNDTNVGAVLTVEATALCVSPGVVTRHIESISVNNSFFIDHKRGFKIQPSCLLHLLLRLRLKALFL